MVKTGSWPWAAARRRQEGVGVWGGGAGCDTLGTRGLSGGDKHSSAPADCCHLRMWAQHCHGVVFFFLKKAEKTDFHVKSPECWHFNTFDSTVGQNNSHLCTRLALWAASLRVPPWANQNVGNSWYSLSGSFVSGPNLNTQCY